MAAKCVELKCHLMACDGAADHLHLLARLPATLCVADFMHHIKGASGHFATHELNLKGFRWSSSYYAASVSPEALDKVRDYIDNQEQRHANRETLSDWERSSDAAAG